jgi:hypothetical protein
VIDAGGDEKHNQKPEDETETGAEEESDFGEVLYF